MLAETHKKQISNLLFIIWAGGAALFSYALVYALRKPFTAATFDGLEFMGMDYKTATSIIQIAGYMLSKLLGIKFISELKREYRLGFIIASVAIAEISLILFAVCPVPYKYLCTVFQRTVTGVYVGCDFQFSRRPQIERYLGKHHGTEYCFQFGTGQVGRSFPH